MLCNRLHSAYWSRLVVYYNNNHKAIMLAWATRVLGTLTSLTSELNISWANSKFPTCYQARWVQLIIVAHRTVQWLFYCTCIILLVLYVTLRTVITTCTLCLMDKTLLTSDLTFSYSAVPGSSRDSDHLVVNTNHHCLSVCARKVSSMFITTFEQFSNSVVYILTA